jgi:hypothetical protein
MIDDLRHLRRKDMLTIDDDICKQITGSEDFAIEEIEYAQTDTEQVIIMCLGDYYLIGTDMGGEESFAVCELYDVGLEYLDTDEVSFLDEIDIASSEGRTTYSLTYVTSELESDCAFCEYSTSDDYYDYLLVKRDLESTTVYRGISVGEENIVL